MVFQFIAGGEERHAACDRTFTSATPRLASKPMAAGPISVPFGSATAPVFEVFATETPVCPAFRSLGMNACVVRSHALLHRDRYRNRAASLHR